MLKVVGASGLQIVVSYLILIGILIFGILIIIICRNQNLNDDGKYAAIVKWNSETERYDVELLGQNNNPVDIHPGIARAYYQPNMHQTGWAFLEIESNQDYSDEEQAFASGILEGSLSCQHIYWQWKNTVKSACDNKIEFCSMVRSFLEKNTDEIRKKARAYDKSVPFWHQVNLFYIQLDGIEFGWRYEIRRNKMPDNIPSLDFLWLNIVSDLKDLEKSLSSKEINNSGSPVAMSLLKLTSPENAEFLLAHASSGFYSSMLRIQKKYTFNFHNTGKPNSELVPAKTISFTSYPASIHSQDDFYQIRLNDGSKVTVTGTALLMDYYKNENQTERSRVLLGPRVMAGNRLSTNGRTWAYTVGKFNSGTGNKQWMHIQTKKNQMAFWVLEQTPRKVISRDETDLLYEQGYWISCGIPHFKENVDEMNTSSAEMEEHHSGNIPIKSIVQVLQEGQKNLTNIQSLIDLMRGPELALAGRTDLQEETQAKMENNIAPNPNSSTETNNRRDKLTTDLRRSISKVYSNMLKNVRKNPQFSQKYMSYSDSERNYKNNFLFVYNSTWLRSLYLKNEILLPNLDRKIREKDQFVLSESNLAGYSKSSGVSPIRTIDGVIDLKLTQNNQKFLAAAGPPFNLQNKIRTIEPFQWSKSAIKFLPHDGHSDIWNYEPIEANFVWT